MYSKLINWKVDAMFVAKTQHTCHRTAQVFFSIVSPQQQTPIERSKAEIMQDTQVP